MKIKIFFLLLFIIILISTLGSIILNEFIVQVILLDLITVIFVYGYWLEKKTLKLRLPDLLNSERNFEKLLICDESYVKNINKEKILILSNYNRNFFTDFLILQRYYSFLSTGGECILLFDLNDRRYFENEKINSLDYNFFHIVTLYENGIKPESKLFKLKKILNKFKIVIYKLGIYALFKKSKVNEDEIERYLNELIEFTTERQINLKILIKNINNIHYLKDKYNNIKFQKV